jgi:hypothetical protein
MDFACAKDLVFADNYLWFQRLHLVFFPKTKRMCTSHEADENLYKHVIDLLYMVLIYPHTDIFMN